MISRKLKVKMRGVEPDHASDKEVSPVGSFFFSNQTAVRQVMLEEILDIRNIEKALKQVTANKGAGGIDGMQTDELRHYLNANWQELRIKVLEGSYQPQAVRKVEIPKAQGGTRMLGIPTVIDRLLQQAIAQWLIFQYEVLFSQYSYGFREKHNAHQAVLQAQQNLNDGNDWVIELDMEKFFDKVNHDRLMSTLARKVTDKRTLKLIRSYLRSGIMEGGMVSPRTEGTPQGSPLSPLLSNIVLDELDKELHLRGHRFVRYADDCSIYVKSEKSAYRVMESITVYIEKRLKLKVNRSKSKVSQPQESRLLGFSFYRSKEGWQIRISEKSIERIKKRMKEKTRRNDPSSAKEKIKKMEAVIRGWVNYFAIARGKSKMQELDKIVRTRLRIGLWKQWKTPRSKRVHLIQLGAPQRKACQWSNSRKGYCRIAHSPILCEYLSKDYFLRLGYVGFFKHYFWKTEHQRKLF